MAVTNARGICGTKGAALMLSVRIVKHFRAELDRIFRREHNRRSKSHGRAKQIDMHRKSLHGKWQSASIVLVAVCLAPFMRANAQTAVPAWAFPGCLQRPAAPISKAAQISRARRSREDSPAISFGNCSGFNRALAPAPPSP